MSPIRLLVVDDDRINRLLASKILADQGYTVDVADGGAAALKLVEKQPYALVVLDFEMPEMDGVELFRRIHDLHPETIGIFLTAFTTINTVFPAIAAGVERVLPKPVRRDELIALVESLVGRPEVPV
ncbi:MAG: response regulator [Planctomycetaceae bacterium]|nr:response regulator [Planctomycetaceae bacterium]